MLHGSVCLLPRAKTDDLFLQYPCYVQEGKSKPVCSFQKPISQYKTPEVIAFTRIVWREKRWKMKYLVILGSKPRKIVAVWAAVTGPQKLCIPVAEIKNLHDQKSNEIALKRNSWLRLCKSNQPWLSPLRNFWCTSANHFWKRYCRWNRCEIPILESIDTYPWKLITSSRHHLPILQVPRISLLFYGKWPFGYSRFPGKKKL